MDKNKILAIMKVLYPPISDMHSDAQLLLYIEMSMPIVATEGVNLAIPQQEFACACLSLYFATMSSTEGSIAKKKIRDVEIMYSQSGNVTNKWKEMYDAIISGGDSITDDKINYIGV